MMWMKLDTDIIQGKWDMRAKLRGDTIAEW